MDYTTRHQFGYPVNADVVDDAPLVNFAQKLDDVLDIQSFSGSFKVARNLCMYEERGTNLSGYVVIDTNIPFGNHMCTLNIQGYSYAPFSNIIDCTVSFYAYEAAVSIENPDFINNGTFEFESVQILRRDSTGTVSVALRPYSTNLQWQYPKMWVDGSFGHVSLPTANLKSGWSMLRRANLNGYTVKKNMNGFANWTDVTDFANNWTHLDSRRLQYTKTYDGWVKFRGLITNTAPPPAMYVSMFTLPPGFRPQQRAQDEHHMVTSSNMGVGQISINYLGQVRTITNVSGSWVDLTGISFKAASP